MRSRSHGKLPHVCTSAVAEEGDLRLVDSLSTSVEGGRLEIYLRGEWGTVCSHGFGFEDGDVACRQLGFTSATRIGTVGQLG